MKKKKSVAKRKPAKKGNAKPSDNTLYPYGFDAVLKKLMQPPHKTTSKA